ncbi:MAG: UvrB/UvrC motif-containing protein [Victivallaceae bacterium]|nr:UvrB/UvrC motif-containing protein [Victivallaceae bacterium]
MLCDICKKNQATVHLKEIVNGNQKVLNLCAACAEAKVTELAVTNFNLTTVLYHLSENLSAQKNAPASADNSAEPSPPVVCPSCHWSLEKLRESNGRLGCPQCYQTFAPMIADALKNVQRGPRHRGKHPGSEGNSANSDAYLELAHLQHQLDEKVKLEEFEEAAKLRDRINELKSSSAR